MVNTRRDPYKLRRLRQIVQTVFLAVFVFLLVNSLLGREFRSRILQLVMTMTAVMLTLILGRVWCGWVCPVGTILYWTRFKEVKKWGKHLSNHWSAIKYLLLLLTLILMFIGLVPPVIDWMRANVTISVIMIVVVLGVSVGLNRIADLFWCRYLCPLGGAVALLSKMAPMQRIVRRHCNDCSICVDACPMGVIDPRRDFANSLGECTVCIDCLTACTSSSNGFNFSNPFGGRR